MQRFTTMLLVAAGLIAVVGCGGSDFPDPVPVSGKVTYKGQPVEGATVTFLSKTGGRSASGKTNAQGEFQLTTFNTNDGAIPGEYTVTIAKVESTVPAAEIDVTSGDPGELYGQMMDAVATGQGLEKFHKDVLPAKYGNPAESGLSRTVADGPNNFTFDLE